MVEGQKKIEKEEKKIGKKRQTPEGSFTLPFLTYRAGYATEFKTELLSISLMNK